MDPNQSQIKWDFLKIMHDNDKLLPGQMRICPKLTEKHLNLSNSAKMRVCLAVQVLIFNYRIFSYFNNINLIHLVYYFIGFQ